MPSSASIRITTKDTTFLVVLLACLFSAAQAQRPLPPPPPTTTTTTATRSFPTTITTTTTTTTTAGRDLELPPTIPSWEEAYGTTTKAPEGTCSSSCATPPVLELKNCDSQECENLGYEVPCDVEQHWEFAEVNTTFGDFGSGLGGCCNQKVFRCSGHGGVLIQVYAASCIEPEDPDCAPGYRNIVFEQTPWYQNTTAEIELLCLGDGKWAARSEDDRQTFEIAHILCAVPKYCYKRLTAPWTPWEDVAPCDHFCGGKGNVTKRRECIETIDPSDGKQLECEGESEVTVPCRDQYPCADGSCREGFTIVDLKCQPIDPTVYAVVDAPPPDSPCTPAKCPPNGTWSDWYVAGPCNDTCGYCGHNLMQRRCLSMESGCPCEGESEKYSPCTSDLCTFPRNQCCDGYKKTINNDGRFACGPINPHTEAPEPSPETGSTTEPGENPVGCTDPLMMGTLDIWSAWDLCTAPCGACGTQKRTRKCLSEEQGCPCTHPLSHTLQERACNQKPCEQPSSLWCCPNSTIAYTAEGETFCQPGGDGESSVPKPTTPAPTTTQATTTTELIGDWVDQFVNELDTCSDTCGLCGNGVLVQRTCVPTGAKCLNGPEYFSAEIKAHPMYNYMQGDAEVLTGPCGNALCTFPKQQCCEPFKKIIQPDGKKFVCGVPPP